MRIYLAGPLFTMAERYFNFHMASALRAAGHEVFVPQELDQEGLSKREIFLADVAGVDWSELVLANMDGPDPDSGTCWECGYAFRRKFVVVFRTSCREKAGPFGPFNLMLTQSADKVISMPGFNTNMDMLLAAILEAIKGLRK